MIILLLRNWLIELENLRDTEKEKLMSYKCSSLLVACSYLFAFQPPAADRFSPSQLFMLSFST